MYLDLDISNHYYAIISLSNRARNKLISYSYGSELFGIQGTEFKEFT